MKAYIYRTGTTISPFGDDVSTAQVMLETLAQTQERACRRNGLELVRIEKPSDATERPCVLAADWTYFSEKALRDFLSTAREKKRPGAAMALRRCASVEHMLPLQDVVLQDWDDQKSRGRAVYDLWLVPKTPEGPLPDRPGEVRAFLEQRCPPLVVPMREITIPVRLPVLGEEEKFLNFPITSTVCCHISHWTHLLWMTTLSFGIGWMEYIRAHKTWTILKVLGTIFRRFSLNKWKILSRMRVRGKGCDIHPTAYLEASILGNGVKVGAGACIRNCLIGDNVIIADHVKLINSVIGENCYLTENTFVGSSLCYPGSTIGNVRMQVAVIGKEVYLHGWFTLMDAKFIGDVKVMHQGKRVGTGRSFMASCVGHRAILGAKVLLLPGREVPNDLLMVSRPEDVIAEVPADIPPRTPMVRDRGTLVTLESLKKK